MFFVEILIGIVGGIVAGMGMGGGSLTIPLLTLVLGYKQIRAQGINLVSFLPMSIVALIIHAKNKLVEFKRCWILALVGCLFSFLTALLANKLNNTVLKKMFALFLIALGIWQMIELINSIKNKKKTKQSSKQSK